MARKVEYCETCKANREVHSVEESSDGKELTTLVCGHTFPRITKSVKENVGISDNTYWRILKDHIEEIRKAVEDNDYFKIVAYACSIFEYCGKQILVWHSRKAGKPLSPQNVAKCDLYSVINELFSHKILTDMDVKQKMHSIRCLRNSFVYEGYLLNLFPFS